MKSIGREGQGRGHSHSFYSVLVIYYICLLPPLPPIDQFPYSLHPLQQKEMKMLPAFIFTHLPPFVIIESC